MSALLATQLLTATAASAHTELVGSTPADGAQIDAATEVTLTFSEAVGPEFSDVVVTGADGSTWQAGAAQVDGATVTQPLSPDIPGGVYDVAWRVVSDDGHPVTGTLSVTVAAAAPTAASTGAPSTAASSTTVAAATPTPPASSSSVNAAPAAASSDEGGTNWLPIAAVLLVVMIALGAGAFVLSRRRAAGGA